MSFNTRQENWLTESNQRSRLSRTASCLLSDFELQLHFLSVPNVSAARLGLKPGRWKLLQQLPRQGRHSA